VLRISNMYNGEQQEHLLCHNSLKIIGFFCKRDLQKRCYSAKETYNFIYNIYRTANNETDKRYRVAKTHRMSYLYRSFSEKEPYN